MARKKNGKSLFEVMRTGESQDAKSLDVPSWFDRSGQKAPPGDGPGDAPRIPQPISLRPDPAPEARREPILSVSTGRLVISLNQISAVVVILAIILLCVAAYMLGRRGLRNTSASPDQIRAPRNPGATRPGTGSVKGLPVPDSPPPKQGGSGMASDAAKRQKGYSYLVIQGGVLTLKEAMDIKRFLYAKGVNATIHRMKLDGMYMVQDMRGFTNLRSAETRAALREHVAQVEKLGKLYMSQGGRYDFKQRSSTGPWMITEK